jgi:hypothetical protein
MNSTGRDAGDDLKPFSPEEEAEMQAEIELALDPYRKMAPPKLLAEMRKNLEDALRTHPYPRQLLRGFAPRSPVVASGEALIDGSQPSDEKAGGKPGS